MQKNIAASILKKRLILPLQNLIYHIYNCGHVANIIDNNY